MKYLVAVLLRAAVLSLLWVFFSGSWVEYAAYGAVSVAVATAISLWVMPPVGPVRVGRWPRRLWFSLTLVLWFGWQSVLGGVDVAVRSLRRPVRIEPAVITAEIQLPEGNARQLAMVMMNLMPGSMIQRTMDSSGATAQTTGQGPTCPPEQVELHTLAAELDPADQWQQLQHRVARAFE